MPPPLVGAALIVTLWLPLWWLVSGRKRLSWRCWLALAVADSVFVLHFASRGLVVAGAIEIVGVVGASINALIRWALLTPTKEKEPADGR